MAVKRLGGSSVKFENPPAILGYAAVGSKKEGEGPLAAAFDSISDDPSFGEKSWEKAESHMLRDSLHFAAAKANVAVSSLNYIFAGDLLNQCISSTFGLRDFAVPFFGLYGACSTMAESLTLAAMSIDGGFADCAAAMTSSHFCSAERQYRFPLDYGGQRTPTAQWTATAAGAVLLGAAEGGVRICGATTGCITDFGVTDAGNMGAAMAPAAAATLTALFQDTGTTPSDYDRIFTGDLGQIGKSLLIRLTEDDSPDFESVYEDCGCMLYAPEQDVKSGASGCGCSAAVLCTHIIPALHEKKYRRVIFAGTGALLSPVSTQQGESIPSVCHAVILES